MSTVLTNGNDIHFGTPGDDLIWAMGGDDTIYMSQGTDTILADSYSPFPGSEDTLSFQNLSAGVTVAMDPGGTGWGSAVQGSNTTLFKEFENLMGSDHKDTLVGNDEDNVIEGGNGNDFLYGEDGDDYLHGGAGHDRHYDGAGADLFVDSAGYDRFYFTADSETDTLKIDLGDGGHKENVYGFDVTQDQIQTFGTYGYADWNFTPWDADKDGVYESTKAWVGNSGEYAVFHGVLAVDLDDPGLFVV